MILNRRSSEDALTVADNHMASYLRVYDASIQLDFGRDGKGRRSGNGKRLFNSLNVADPDYGLVAKHAGKENCEFLVFQVPSERADEIGQIMKKYGYERISAINNYNIFQISG